MTPGALIQQRSKAPICLQLFILTMALSGCASRYSLTSEVDKPLGEIRSAISKAMPLGVKVVTENGRRFESADYQLENGRPSHPKGGPYRFKAIARIRGERRPYRIEVEVMKLRRMAGRDKASSELEVFGFDSTQSQKIAKEVEFYIREGVPDRNIIDDFRVF